MYVTELNTMDIVERIKIEVRQKNWLESIRRQQESGMDVKEWCLQEKIMNCGFSSAAANK